MFLLFRCGAGTRACRVATHRDTIWPSYPKLVLRTLPVNIDHAAQGR
ncbi:MAG TPA: hypothetical protein VN633_23695 [Bryobacteraceae bacterium]|nr:hypothetical protein [Bryobacteraceae bacterium]